MRRSNEERGFTLVELLVVILVLGIIGAFTATALIRGMQTTTDVDQRVTAYGELQQGGSRITRELRAVHATCSGTAMDAFTAAVVIDRGGDRFRYTYSLPTGSEEVTVDLDQWNDATAAWTDVTSGSVVVEVDNHSMTDEDLFIYLDEDGNAIATPVADPGRVNTITMNLWRRAPDDAINLDQSVHLRNGGLPCPSR